MVGFSQHIVQILFQFPAAFIKKSMAPSLLTLCVTASPCFFFLSQNWLCIDVCCHVRLTSTWRCSRHTRVRDGGLGGKMGGLSANRVSLWIVTEGGDALPVRVRLRPQDKNVFDIACNCVMFALLVSEGACISKQASDCHFCVCWWVCVGGRRLVGLAFFERQLKIYTLNLVSEINLVSFLHHKYVKTWKHFLVKVILTLTYLCDRLSCFCSALITLKTCIFNFHINSLAKFYLTL